MVDSIDNGSYNSLQRIQQIALANLKNNQKVAQALLNSVQTSAVSKTSSANAVMQSVVAFATSSKTTVPRGSLVDKLV